MDAPSQPKAKFEELTPQPIKCKSHTDTDTLFRLVFSSRLETSLSLSFFSWLSNLPLSISVFFSLSPGLVICLFVTCFLLFLLV